jgi:hydrogenase maturation protease
LWSRCKGDMKTLILGIGNTALTDDGVGCKVAQRLKKRLRGRSNITVKETALSGLSLLDEITGYERLIIIDAIQTRGGKPGDIYKLSPGDFKIGRMAIIHDLGLVSTLELGRKLEMDMPREVVIFAIEAKEMATFSEKLSPEVEKAVPKAVEVVLAEVGGDASID